MTQQTSGGSWFFSKGTPEAAANSYKWEFDQYQNQLQLHLLTANNNFQAVKHIDVCFF